MAKITLDSAVSGYNSTTIYNSNNDLLEEALNEKVLYRDNPSGEPNQMESALDMNSNRMFNLPSPLTGTEPARWNDIRDGVSVIAEAIPNIAENIDKVLVSDGDGLVFKDHQFIASDYATLRARLTADIYKSGDIVTVASVSTPGINGQFIIVDIGTLVDDGGITITGGSFAAVRQINIYGICAAWFEVVPDGVTINTNNLQKFFDAARLLAQNNLISPSNGSDFRYIKCILPEGVIKTDGNIDIYKYGLHIIGTGTTIFNTASLNFTLGAYDTVRGPEDQLQTLFEDVCFYGLIGALNDFTNTNTCILFDRVSRPQFYRCTWIGYGKALDFNGTIYPHFKHCQFRANSIVFTGDTESGRVCNFVTFEDCLIFNNRTIGIMNGGSLTFIRVNAEQNNPNNDPGLTMLNLNAMSGSAASPAAVFEEYHTELNNGVREIYFSASTAAKCIVFKDCGIVGNGITGNVVQQDSGRIHLQNTTLFAGAGGTSYQGASGVRGVFINHDLSNTPTNVDEIVFVNEGNISIGKHDTSADMAFFSYSSGVFRGGIQALTSGRLDLRSGAGTWHIENSGQMRPSVDNTYSFGSASLRPTELYAVSGTINTSDEREKTDWVTISEAEKRVALTIKSQIKKYRWIASVNSKGTAARWHWGIGAQTLKEAFEAEGLDANSYGMFCYDVWYTDKNGNECEKCHSGAKVNDRYGVRYDQVIMFLMAADIY